MTQPGQSHIGVRAEADPAREKFWICADLDCNEALPGPVDSGERECPRCGAEMIVAGRYLRLERAR